MVFGKIYSYPNNPRVQKSLIAAQYAKIDIEVKETKIGVDTTSADFLAKFPLGKVPTFEGADGFTIYESNAIAYYVASQQPLLLGKDKKDQAIVQQYIAFADNEFAPVQAAWLYPILGFYPVNEQATEKAKKDCKRALQALDAHLKTRTFLVGERVTLADIVMTCQLLNFYKMVFEPAFINQFKNVNRWFLTCVNQPQFKKVLGEVQVCEKMAVAKPVTAEKAAPAPKPAEAKPAATTAAETKPEGEEKKKNPLDLLPKSTFILDEWKRVYSNNDTRPTAVDYFWKNFDPQGYSIFRVEYKYNNELTQVFMSSNLIGGFFQRLERARKYAFGSMLVLGENGNNEIYGYFVIRGAEVPFEFTDTADYESYKFTKVDITKKEIKDDIERVFAWEDTKGRKFADGKVFK
jgi:elongation factor 1-gamma